MKLSSHYLVLAVTAVALLGGCTKKSTTISPDKTKVKPTADAAATDLKDKKNAPEQPQVTGDDSSKGGETGGDAGARSGGAQPPALPVPIAGQPTPAAPVAAPPFAAPNLQTVVTPQPPVMPAVPAAPAKPPAAQPVKMDAATAEKCIKKNAEEMLVGAKKIGQKMVNPAAIIALREISKSTCNILGEDSANLLPVINKALSEIVLVAYPDSKSIVDYFTIVEARKIKEEEKKNLYIWFGSSVEVQTKGIQVMGALDASLTKDNTITYTVNQFAGSQDIKSQIFDKNPSIKQIDFASAPPAAQKHSFDFTPKANKTNTLTIIEGDRKTNVDFQMANGDLAVLKAKKPVVIMLTVESWSKLVETKMQLTAVAEIKELETVPLASSKISSDPKMVRTCQLDAEKVICKDPDYRSTSTVNPAGPFLTVDAK